MLLDSLLSSGLYSLCDRQAQNAGAFPAQLPSEEVIMASEDGVLRLAGHMLRHVADWMRSEMQYGRAAPLFHFDH